MNKKHIIEQAREFVKDRLKDDASGHDWLHIERVYKNAMEIAQGDFLKPGASPIGDGSSLRSGVASTDTSTSSPRARLPDALILSLSKDRPAVPAEATQSEGWEPVEGCEFHKRSTEKKDMDLFTVELAAIFHDVADWKFCDGDENLAPSITRNFLEKYAVEESIIDHVCDIIKNISYKGQGAKSVMKTKEGQIVQDADRLDAIGAIGIVKAK